jgi:heptosyltransferase II
MIPRMDCVLFSGSKPCGRSSVCDSTCTSFQKRGKQILFIHLGALGAVVRSTALLKSIFNKYPGAQITWVTQAPAQNLLSQHPEIHRVLTLSESDLLSLSVLSFDVAFIIDKSLEASGVFKKTSSQEVFGFQSDDKGVIKPLSQAAEELWEIGISDQKKFKLNQKSEIQLMHEALELEFKLSEYNLPLNRIENDLKCERAHHWSSGGKKIIVGINTGCAATISSKKLSVENHRELIRKIQQLSGFQIVLLGGPEDTSRNLDIAQGFKDLILSPTENGLRDGLVSVAACDIVVTGDSLGMHMAISQKREVIAWFGPTCAVEIELYGRGQKIVSEAPCGPCWKRSCHKPVMCYDLVNLDEIIFALRQYQSRFSDGLFRRSSLSHSAFDLDEKPTSGNSIGVDLS